MSKLHFFLSSRHPLGDAEADLHGSEFWEDDQLCSGADCAVEKTVVTLPRCDAEADHQDTEALGRRSTFSMMQCTIFCKMIIVFTRYSSIVFELI